MSRKQKQYHFIYKTTDTRNGNCYIGMHSTDNLNDGYVGSGLRIKNLKYKHGIEIFNIEILEFLPDRESLKKREEEIVNSDLLKEEKCMNLRPGGEGGFTIEQQIKGREISGKIHAERMQTDIKYCNEVKKRLLDITYKNHMEGKYRHDTFIGKHHTDDTKQKIRNTRSEKGLNISKNNTQYGTCWITNGLENKKIKKENIIPNGWYLGRILKN